MIWKKFTTVIILYSSSNKENFVKRVREKSHPEMGGSIYTQEKIKKPPVMYVYPSRRLFYLSDIFWFWYVFSEQKEIVLFTFLAGKMLDDAVEQLQFLFGGTGEQFKYFFSLLSVEPGKLFLQLSFTLWRFR